MERRDLAGRYRSHPPRLRTPTAHRPQRLLSDRICKLCVGLFLIFWGLYYTPPGAVYLYLNITGAIFLAGAFVCVGGGLYWSRANATGGYLAMLMGAIGAVVPFFFLRRSESFAGFASFGLAVAGLLAGSVFGQPLPALTRGEP